MDDDDDDVVMPPPPDESPSAAFTSCPECGTTKLMVPNLALRFSTCCGRVMCVPCIDSRFKSAKTWACTLCAEPLRRTNWDELPLEEQRFRSEVQHRQEGNKSHVLCLEQVDFPSKRAYDDYLEWTAEQVYALTYGGKVASDAALSAMRSFARDNNALIEKSRRRKRAALAEGEKSKLRAALGGDAVAAAPAPPVAVMQVPGGPQVSFHLPQVDTSAAPGMTADQRIAAIQDPVKRRLEERGLQALRRAAGGFKPRDDLARCRQAALDGLFA